MQLIRVDVVAYPETAKDKPVAIGRCTFAVHKLSEETLAKAASQGVKPEQ